MEFKTSEQLEAMSPPDRAVTLQAEAEYRQSNPAPVAPKETPAEGEGAPAADPDPNPKPVDPANADPNATPVEGQQEPQDPADPSGSQDPPANTDPPVMDYSNISEGKYSTAEAINHDLGRIPQLEADLKNAQENPQFASDKAKAIFDFANQYEGMEHEAAQTYLTIQGMDLDKASPKDVRFEAFKLDPQNKGLNSSQLKAIFDENELMYEGVIDPEEGQLEPTELQNIKAIQATNVAKAKLQELKNQYSQASGARTTPEDDTALRSQMKENTMSAITEAGSAFEISIDAKNAEGEAVNGKVSLSLDASQAEAVANASANLEEAFKGQLLKVGAINPDGSFANKAKYAETLARIIMPEAVDRLIYKQGLDDQAIKIVDSHRNPAPVDGSETPAPSNAPAQTEAERVHAGMVAAGGG